MFFGRLKDNCLKLNSFPAPLHETNLKEAYFTKDRLLEGQQSELKRGFFSMPNLVENLYALCKGQMIIIVRMLQDQLLCDDDGEMGRA